MNTGNYNFIENYIRDLQSNGRYTFLFSELKAVYPSGSQALKLALNRYAQKKRIVSLRRGFYVIIPPEYQQSGILPPVLFVDDLMRFIGKPYYVGLLSAAALHGAGHQQPQTFFVVTTSPSHRSIHSDRVTIQFITRKSIPVDLLEQRKTAMGLVTLSNPELTAVDLIHFDQKAGGFARVFEVLEELSEKFDATRLRSLVSCSDIPLTVLQRLGYMMAHHFQLPDLADIVYSGIKDKLINRIPLNAMRPHDQAEVDSKWKIFQNYELEIDA